MKSRLFSLYWALGLIIFITVTLIMSINSAYNYTSTKNRAIVNMQEDSKTTILSLKGSVANMISSYAVNEYDNLIFNEISKRDIYAIIVNDYNMGKILGQQHFKSGKIKINDNTIVDYNPTDNGHTKLLANAFYSNTYDITSPIGKKLGTISIYTSDKKMQEELQEIIIDNIKNTVIISLLLMVILFISIRLFVLKPLSNIIDVMNETDQDGIPLHLIPYYGFKEISALSNSMNKMINEIKRSRVRLKNSQNRLEYLLELSPIAVRIAKKRGKDVIFANNAYSKLLRITKKETIHKNPRDYYTHTSVYDDIIAKLDKNESIYNTTVELSIENDTVWALASYMNIEFDGEKAVIGWFYDITKEKNNEKRLYEALEMQTAIFDSSGYMLIRTDTQGVIQQVNKAAEEKLGYSASELIGLQTPELIHDKDETIKRAQQFSQELETIIEPGFKVFVVKSDLEQTNIHEWTYITKDGHQIPVLLEVTALKDKEHQTYGYLGVAKDITQNKMMESQSKLASMGEMIGNIAHQWRQPLSAISTIASGVRLKSEFDQLQMEDLLEDMDNINAQAQYLSRTIDDFRDFIKNTNDKKHFRLLETVNKALSITSSSMKNHDIELILDLHEDIEIHGFENQLIQSIINIINNAKDAIKEKLPTDSNKYIFVSTKKNNDSLQLIIKDNGGGIDEDIINNIFEPYFTTKHQSVGTGIGLSMAYQIITEHHKASINVSNEKYIYDQQEYIGACFTITFDF